jgi:hypothetical protein
MRKAKISQGDLVRVDYPGTSIHWLQGWGSPTIIVMTPIGKSRF